MDHTHPAGSGPHRSFDPARLAAAAVLVSVGLCFGIVSAELLSSRSSPFGWALMVLFAAPGLLALRRVDTSSASAASLRPRAVADHTAERLVRRLRTLVDEAQPGAVREQLADNLRAAERHRLRAHGEPTSPIGVQALAELVAASEDLAARLPGAETSELVEHTERTRLLARSLSEASAADGSGSPGATIAR